MSVESDPLDQITLRPRTFAAVLVCAAMVIGLVFALIPVRVSSPTITTATKVSCGNSLGGVETPQLNDALGRPDRPTLVSYIDMCERAIDTRAELAWTLFFGGLIGALWLGVVRRGPRSVPQ
jgi:hypothetical protein